MMGKLSDITANASNTGKRLSAASMGYQPLNDTPQSENHAKKAAPPRFMSPTVSSAKQVNAKPSNAAGTTTTPLTSSAKARASGNWMASAAKRVSFNRVPDGTTRSKEGFSKKPKALSFPDKVCQPSNPQTSGCMSASTSFCFLFLRYNGNSPTAFRLNNPRGVCFL